jgi:hypothetical protein
MLGVSLPAVLNQVCLDDFRAVHIDDSAIGWDTEDPDLHFQPLFLFVDFNCLVESSLGSTLEIFFVLAKCNRRRRRRTRRSCVVGRLEQGATLHTILCHHNTLDSLQVDFDTRIPRERFVPAGRSGHCDLVVLRALVVVSQS